ncbi:hypothetical protein BS47DRAFT_501605 [Hydnum rufescens UP504]|uniref:Uncharacterized protein n=1 Tax=Hydnum rufescens UP504 TaxID=1448309 RepID=A0A9P6B4C8_9AGAM|nr:hypothetical protein BS47DRAFT_501605 [Hydnum rufescens UP504]
MKASSFFASDVNGRLVLPAPAGPGRTKYGPILVPAVPSVPRLRHDDSETVHLMNPERSLSSNNTCAHKRNASNSSNTSTDDADSSPSDAESDSTRPTTPGSSRSPSPDIIPKQKSPGPSLRLVPRDPFPSDLTISDITAEDCLVFFPDPSASSRAILLMGPAIARHMHLSSGSRRSSLCQTDSSAQSATAKRLRVHPYRISITNKSSAEKDCATLSMMRRQIEQAKQEAAWRTWAKGAPLERQASEVWEQQRQSICGAPITTST